MSFKYKCNKIRYIIYFYFSQAVKTQTPPALLILFSAILEKNCALTTIGTLGRTPFPKTL